MISPVVYKLRKEGRRLTCRNPVDPVKVPSHDLLGFPTGRFVDCATLCLFENLGTENDQEPCIFPLFEMILGPGMIPQEPCIVEMLVKGNGCEESCIFPFLLYGQ